jgi:hypothetical protein
MEWLMVMPSGWASRELEWVSPESVSESAPLELVLVLAWMELEWALSELGLESEWAWLGLALVSQESVSESEWLALVWALQVLASAWVR